VILLDKSGAYPAGHREFFESARQFVEVLMVLQEDWAGKI